MNNPKDEASSIAATERRVSTATRALRTEFLAAVPQLGEDVLRGPRGDELQRWRREGRVLAVTHEGRDVFPAFQFDVDGLPLPIVTELLAILNRDPSRNEWDNALWFSSDTGWLDGARPLECLQSEPSAVRRAAEQEVLRDTA